MNENEQRIFDSLRSLGYSVGWQIVSKDNRDVWQADAFRGRNFRMSAHGENLEAALIALRAELEARVRKAIESLDLELD